MHAGSAASGSTERVRGGALPKTGAGNRRAKVGLVEGPGPEVGEGQEGRRGRAGAGGASTRGTGGLWGEG